MKRTKKASIAVDSAEPSAARDSPRRGRRRELPKAAPKEPEIETLTVQEAVVRLGVTREEIMAEFDVIMRRHKEKKGRSARSPRRPVAQSVRQRLQGRVG